MNIYNVVRSVKYEFNKSRNESIKSFQKLGDAQNDLRESFKKEVDKDELEENELKLVEDETYCAKNYAKVVLLTWDPAFGDETCTIEYTIIVSSI